MCKKSYSGIKVYLAAVFILTISVVKGIFFFPREAAYKFNYQVFGVCREFQVSVPLLDV